jgi:hypothetical protein
MEIRHVIITIKPPNDRDPVGACEIGFYQVENGMVLMCTEEGKPTGKKVRLGPGDDPEKVAGRLTREAWLRRGGESDFNRRLNYPRSGVA